VTRFNAQPGARYMHPQAPTEAEGDHARALDVAVDSSPNYLRWISDLCRPHLGASVLEVGSGVGSITERLAQGRSMLATEISDDCLAALERRFANVSNVRVARLDLRDPAGDEQFDSVVMINVLEHIRDDAGALSDLRRLLRPSGTLVLYVPALNGLYGPWDRAVGHCRRYSKWRLREVARAAGLVTAELARLLSHAGRAIRARRTLAVGPHRGTAHARNRVPCAGADRAQSSCGAATPRGMSRSAERR
jgi:SAM-dependent methyltransferase